MREYFLGKALLGQGQGAVMHQGDFAAPPYYLLRDEFTTDRAAGSINGTLAEPGPGRRIVTDTNSKISISGGAVVFATGGVTNGDPGIYHGPYPRVVGRVLLLGITITNSTMVAGWDNDTGTRIFDCFRFLTSSLRLDIRTSDNAIAVGAFATSTAYKLALILRQSGTFFFIKGGAFTNWTLMYISKDSTGSPLYPAVSVESTVVTGTADNMYVPATRWLPAPLISDGFSIDSESDGLGHQEGQILASYGQGGAGMNWTDAVGTWAVTDGALAASALSGGRAIRSADAGNADLIITVKMTLSSGTMSLIVRWTDENNFVQLRLTSTNLQLVKVIAGVSTLVMDAAASPVAGAAVTLAIQGTEFRCFYNGAAYGVAFTIADAALQSSTVVGLRTDNTGNTFDDFVVYARGSGGEYNDALNDIQGAQYLTGATWAIDGNGRAYNTPTLGSEALASWTNLSMETLVTDGRIITSATNTTLAGICYSTVNLTHDTWYTIQITHTVISGDPVSIRTADNLSGSNPDSTFILSAGANLFTFRSAGNPYFLYRWNNGNVGDFASDPSIKACAASSLLATTQGTGNQTPLAKINAIAANTQAGVIGWLDDPTNPQDFVIAIRNGSGNVNLTKCVAGVHTNLISISSTFVADAAIEIRRPSGNTFQLFYNGAQVGTDQTISDVAIANNATPYYGAFSTYSGNTFGEFTLDGTSYLFPGA